MTSAPVQLTGNGRDLSALGFALHATVLDWLRGQGLTGAKEGCAEGESEGLGTPERRHPVQREVADRGGSQCGSCTPGFGCSLAAEFHRPEREGSCDLHALSGNLCRCTGYRPIRDAAAAFGRPEPDDPWAARHSHPAPGPLPTRIEHSATRVLDEDEVAAAAEMERAALLALAGSADG